MLKAGRGFSSGLCKGAQSMQGGADIRVHCQQWQWALPGQVREQ